MEDLVDLYLFWSIGLQAQLAKCGSSPYISLGAVVCSLPVQISNFPSYASCNKTTNARRCRFITEAAQPQGELKLSGQPLFLLNFALGALLGSGGLNVRRERIDESRCAPQRLNEGGYIVAASLTF